MNFLSSIVSNCLLSTRLFMHLLSGSMFEFSISILVSGSTGCDFVSCYVYLMKRLVIEVCLNACTKEVQYSLNTFVRRNVKRCAFQTVGQESMSDQIHVKC